MTRLLRAAKYEVRSYASAAEFLEADPSAAPGCALVDLKMPKVSGLDVQEALARTEDRLPIIFLTGHGDIPASVRAMKAGAVDFLTKPVRRETLLRAVENALGLDARARAARAVLRGQQACMRTSPRGNKRCWPGVSGFFNHVFE